MKESVLEKNESSVSNISKKLWTINMPTPTFSFGSLCVSFAVSGSFRNMTASGTTKKIIINAAPRNCLWFVNEQMMKITTPV